MLVVLASRFDRGSAALVDRWAAHDAGLLTPADLSRRGWRDRSGGAPDAVHAPGTAVVAGRVVDCAAIDAVLIRLPVVMPEELGHVAAADRAYMAAEMTAFLVSWLTRLPCPVINRPTPVCLTGVAWRQPQWLHAAAAVGLPAAAPAAMVAPRSRVTVVGGRCVGHCPPAVAVAAVALAGAAGMALLHLELCDGAVAAVSVAPPLDDAEVAEAVLALLLGGGGR